MKMNTFCNYMNVKQIAMLLFTQFFERVCFFLCTIFFILLYLEYCQIKLISTSFMTLNAK